MRWAILESILDLNLIKLLGKDVREGRSLVVFNHMAFPQKLDVLAALVNELRESGYRGLEMFQSVQSLLKQAQEKRNSLIHGKIGTGDATGQVYVSRITARGKLKMSVSPLSIDDIRAISELIYNAGDAVHAFVNDRAISKAGEEG